MIQRIRPSGWSRLAARIGGSRAPEPAGHQGQSRLRKSAKLVQAQKTNAPADRAGDMLTARCREFGVEAALSEIAGISPPMLVALGENGIKTV